MFSVVFPLRSAPGHSKLPARPSISGVCVVRQVKLAIFRTSNGCGWGVRALEPIKRGTFVAEYVGEVITNEEAERRGEKYGAWPGLARQAVWVSRRARCLWD